MQIDGLSPEHDHRTRPVPQMEVGDERSFRLRMMRLSSDDDFAWRSDKALDLIGCRTELQAAGTSGSRGQTILGYKADLKPKCDRTSETVKLHASCSPNC